MADENALNPFGVPDSMAEPVQPPPERPTPGRILTGPSSTPKDILYTVQSEMRFGLTDPKTNTSLGSFEKDIAGGDFIEDSASGIRVPGYIVNETPAGGLRRRRSYTKKPERAHPKEKQTRKGRVRSKRNRHREQKRVG